MKKYLILSVFFISLCSCRVAKKQWVKENYAEISTLNSSIEKQTQAQKLEINEIKETLNAKLTEISQQQHAKNSETETTTISGTLDAELGTNKSVSFGGTTIKSNGASVSFTTTNSKESVYESRFQEFNKILQVDRAELKQLKVEMNSLLKEMAQIKATLDIKAETKTQTVKKTGFQFGVWVIGAIVIIVTLVLWYFRKSIPFLS